jgi:hypothetical protein
MQGMALALLCAPFMCTSYIVARRWVCHCVCTSPGSFLSAAAAAAAAAAATDVLYASLSALDAHEALAEGVTAEHSLHMAFIIQMFKQVRVKQEG